MKSTQKHHEKAEATDLPISRNNTKLSELIKVMQNIKTDTPEAKANETSMVMLVLLKEQVK